ncbi:MAG: hypothetical protein ISS52_08495 [Dehalococcoidia bacterium]|nr:hypothetical protein [Dehalococcoidia bacterium]
MVGSAESERSHVSQRMGRFVYIIESPGDKDFVLEQTEGAVLTEALKLCRIPCNYVLAVSRQTFLFVLGPMLDTLMGKNAEAIPIIHFSAHGSKKGIQLTDKSVMEWGVLGERLAQVNSLVGGELIVCLSSCHSMYAGTMVLSSQYGTPFHFYVGSKGSPDWDVAAVAFVAFYHRLLRRKGGRMGGPISRDVVYRAVKAMRAASGHDGFMWGSAEWLRRQALRSVGRHGK